MSQPLERPVPRRLLPWLPLAVSLVHITPQIDLSYGGAYFLFDYRHGFVKRGLLGSLFSHMAHISRGQARLFELAILFLAIAITYAILRKPLFTDTRMTTLAAMLLCGPSLLPHFTQMFIPTDPLLYTLALVSMAMLLLPDRTLGWGASLLLCCTALLVHEGFSVRFYPLVLAVLLFQAIRGRLRWPLAVAHLLIVFTAFVAIVHFGKQTTAPITYALEARARAGYTVDPQLYLLMHETPAEAQKQSMDFVLTRGTLQLFALSFLLALPYAAGVIAAMRRASRAAGMRRWQTALTGLMFCSPLLLCPVTTDWTRWVSDCLICATLFVFFLYLQDDEDGPVRNALRQFSGSESVTFLLGYVCAIGPFSVMWLSAANTMTHGYFDRFTTHYYDQYGL